MAELAKLEPMTDGKLFGFAYTDDLPDEAAPGRDLLVSYSKIPADEVDSHIHLQRGKAWAICPYPCVGRFRFLELNASRIPVYPQVVADLNANGDHTLLDMACCFAQELRKLTADGVPSKQLYGADLRPDFIELGYGLFRDRDSFEATFYTGDALAERGSADEGQLAKLDGKINYIIAAAFLHLFNWDDQIVACKRLITFLKPTGPAVIFGTQMGSSKPGNYGRSKENGEPGIERVRFAHNDETFKEMWDLVGQQTGTKWDVKVWLRDAPAWIAQGAEQVNSKGMGFAVTRIST